MQESLNFWDSERGGGVGTPSTPPSGSAYADCIDCIILYVLLEWPKIDNAPRQAFFNSEQRKQSAWT